MTEPAPASESLEQAFAGERQLLFGLCYRMTGSAAPSGASRATAECTEK